MTPSGDGANLAMFDGAELAAAIAAHPGDVEAALRAYERDLFPRSEAKAIETADGLRDVLFGAGSPRSAVEFFTQHEVHRGAAEQA